MGGAKADNTLYYNEDWELPNIPTTLKKISHLARILFFFYMQFLYK